MPPFSLPIESNSARDALLADHAAELADPNVIIPRFSEREMIIWSTYVAVPEYDVRYKTKEGFLARIKKGGFGRPCGYVTFPARLLDAWRAGTETTDLPAELGGITYDGSPDETEILEYGETTENIRTVGFDTSHPSFENGEAVWERVTWTEMRARTAALSAWIEECGLAHAITRLSC